MSEQLTRPNGFEVQGTSIEGLWRINFKVITDERGSVMEFYRESDFIEAGLPTLGKKPQINAPLSTYGSLRGIHAEYAHKYVGVAVGNIYAAIVDLRDESETKGQWQGFYLSRGQGLFVSKGLGNSFQSVSSIPSIYLYCFEEEWQPNMVGRAVNPLDPTLGIDWPVPYSEGMIISDKDLSNPSLKEALQP